MHDVLSKYSDSVQEEGSSGQVGRGQARKYRRGDKLIFQCVWWTGCTSIKDEG